MRASRDRKTQQLGPVAIVLRSEEAQTSRASRDDGDDTDSVSRREMSPRYFVWIGSGEIRGPYSREQMKLLVKRGLIKSCHQIHVSGVSGWHRAAAFFNTAFTSNS